MGVSTGQAVPATPSSTATFEGFPYDRVNFGEEDFSLRPGGSNDALYALNVSYQGTHEITLLQIFAGGSVWNMEDDGSQRAGDITFDVTT